MNLKTPQLAGELLQINPHLHRLLHEFAAISQALGIEPTLTRLLEDIPGATGVHPVGRGADFRDEFMGKFTYTEAQRNTLLKHFNTKYRRKDGKSTLIWHRVTGSVYHFHLQVPLDWNTVYTVQEAVEVRREEKKRMANIKETKEALVAVRALSLFLISQLKDGVDAGDVAALIQKLMSDAEFKRLMEEGYQGISGVQAEMGDLQMSEVFELVHFGIESVPMYVEAFKT